MFQPRLTAPEFALIARTIYEAPIPAQSRHDLTMHFADRLAKGHPLFDRPRFVRACLNGDNRKLGIPA